MRAGRLEMAPGQPVSSTVAVELINVPATTLIGALTIEVTYDGAKLTVTACGPAADNRFTSVLCNTNTAGVVRISALSTTGVTDSALIAQLTLQSLGQAATVVPLGVTINTFVDVNANPVVVSAQDGAVIFRCHLGDVNCDNEINPTDALFMMQHEQSLRPASATIPPPRGFLYLAACDLKGDQLCNRDDARLILECEIGRVNGLCQGGN